jgi:O-antigen/teichoic acid export membrane protein
MREPFNDDSLVKITRGAGLVLVGLLAARILFFIVRLLIARYGLEADYGVYSLGAAVFNIGAVIAVLGMSRGVSRSIAHARGQKDMEKVQNLIPASLYFGLLASIALAAVIFFASDILAARVFHDVSLAFPLKLFALGLPFITVISIFTSIFVGFADVKPTVYLQNILRGVLFVVFLLPVVFLDLPFAGVYYAFLASIGITCAVTVIYARRRLPVPIRFRSSLRANTVARELLFFSLPLLGMQMLNLIIGWTDTLMLGSFKSAIDVGLYNAANPPSALIAAPLNAIRLIYLPVTTTLWATGAIAEMRRNFTILTKWLCVATMPLFLVLFFFPETVLGFLFGASYVSAASTLRILAIGFILSNFLGPNGTTLIAMGHPRFVMWATVAAVVVNVGLNATLIPPLGIEGAAIASLAAIMCSNFMNSGRLYSLSKIQPFSKNLLKPTLTSLALIFLFQFVFTRFVTVAWWMLPVLFIAYYAAYGLAILLTRSFDREDIAMLLAMEKRAGIDLSFIKRILRRFV